MLNISLKKLVSRSVLSLSLLGVIACSQADPKLVRAPAGPNNNKVNGADELVSFNPQVDILFVVDDSGSMEVKQANLAANVKLFVDEIQKFSILDFHIGVVTSSIGSYTGSKAANGQLNGSVRYVDKNTPHLVDILKDNLHVGSNGSATEMFFEPIAMALSAPNLTGYNAGFYRNDAYLMTIFITDAEDQSDKWDPDTFYQFLLNLKNQDRDKILTNGVIIPVADQSCERSGEDPPVRTEQFLKMSNGVEFGLCDPDYGTKLAGLGKLLVTRSNVVYLTRAPRIDSVVVMFGTQEIPQARGTGWVYDPARNAIILGSDIIWTTQPKGTHLSVNFVPGDYPEPTPVR